MFGELRKIGKRESTTLGLGSSDPAWLKRGGRSKLRHYKEGVSGLDQGF